MGMYYYHKKIETDDLLSIDVYWLNKHGYFQGSKGGGIDWSTNNGFETKTNSIGIYCFVDDGNRYLRLQYYDKKQTPTAYDYLVKLTRTPCNYGGYRWWFICPLSHCGRRVGALYKAGGMFGCRHCYDLTYSSKNLNRRSAEYGTICAIKAAKAAYKLEPEIKRRNYAGRPTKKQTKYYKLYEQSSGRCFILDDGTVLL